MTASRWWILRIVLLWLVFQLLEGTVTVENVVPNNMTTAMGHRNHSLAFNNDTALSQAMKRRLNYLLNHAEKSLLVHVHIPKAGGTALSSALSTECRCYPNRDPPNCNGCKNLVGTKGMRVPYSISRSSGWKIGVHSPYAFMKHVLNQSPQWEGLAKNDITPVFVILLRSPFERFISEIEKWGGDRGQAVDWSIVHRNSEGEARFYRGANESFLRGGSAGGLNTSVTVTAAEDFRTRLRLYAALSPDLIYHNRQVKMIGGTVSQFDMNFDPKAKLGSRWRPHPGHSGHKKKHPKDNSGGEGNDHQVRDKRSLVKELERAYKVLGQQPDVLIGLEERFAETICTLEVVYGHLYRFHWNPTVNSHDTEQKIDLAERLQSKSEVYPELYEVWKQHNGPEEALYATANRLFEVQFQQALQVLRNRTVAGTAQPQRTPHCTRFLQAAVVE